MNFRFFFVTFQSDEDLYPLLLQIYIFFYIINCFEWKKYESGLCNRFCALP